MVVTALTLLHVLILVYWLGGDLGAFYASWLVVDAKLPVPARLAAVRILNHVDLAPGTCLILALPTGLSLAAAKGWLEPGTGALVLVWLGAAAWVVVAWRVQLRTGGIPLIRRLDRIARWAAMLALAAVAVAGLAGIVALPLFIALKLLILAATFALGLVIREILKRFTPAFVGLITEGSTPERERIIGRTMDQAKAMVLAIWLLILIAGVLGLATPGSF